MTIRFPESHVDHASKIDWIVQGLTTSGRPYFQDGPLGQVNKRNTRLRTSLADSKDRLEDSTVDWSRLDVAIDWRSGISGTARHPTEFVDTKKTGAGLGAGASP